MAEQDLNYISAQQAAALIRRRKLSPVELIEAVLAQIERIAPLNAFVTVLHEQARAAARTAEQSVMRGEALAPLHGVPVHVKDQVNTAGIRTTLGSAIFADNVPVRDDTLITQLRAAGAILVGKTRLPEFGNKGLTDGPSFGTTLNPWDTTRTCGGSSGGAAAAIAAGVGPLALGTDGAGSIRIPAACCGVVGHKPTLGTVPWEAAIDGFSNYTYAGPITRSVSDAAVMLRVLASASPRDPWSLNGPKDLALSPGLVGHDLSGVRVGWIRKAANPQLDPDMEANARACLDALAGLGAEVEDVTEPIDWIEFPGRIMYQGNFHVAMQKHLPQWQNQMDPTLLAFVERGGKFSMADFRNAQYARTTLFRSIQALLGKYDVLVTPTLTRTALAADFDAANDEVVVNGVKCGITRLGWTAYVYPFNLTGHPALTVPSGFAADGLPTSLQIVGRWGADMDVLRLGALIEQARPWSGKRPKLPG
jgi:aspartyl-tRNA(Asn)/glutamyl-tRNA(Gln) amidotransferase subunit A